MTDAFQDDLPSALTRLLRNVDGVLSVYATRSVVTTVITAVAEAVKNEPVGMHLVTVTDDDDGRGIAACIGVTSDEPASDVCRRAHDALSDYFTSRAETAPTRISVKVGRVG